MAQILTFLGKGGSGRTTVAVAAAKKLATQGKRVLLVEQDPGPTLGLLLGRQLTASPQPLGPSLAVVQLQSAPLVERGWDLFKQLESQYLRTPFVKGVYGEELGVLPGMDSAIALYALWDYARHNTYDILILDGISGFDTLRTLGTLEVGSWYLRRFGQVLAESDLGKSLAPFLPPVLASIANVSWTGDNWTKPLDEAKTLLEEGRRSLSDPRRCAAFLVTTGDAASLATARYLWGAAQQINITVGGAIQTPSPSAESAESGSATADRFQPLGLSKLPVFQQHNPADNQTDDQAWEPLMAALPDFEAAALAAPQPLAIDVANRQVRVFLPGFDKSQVRLTQYGPELTVGAGDQRRNILLPEALQGRTVTGAKFQDHYLIVSL
jgi:anion-transporting  ArsA/GET3 family ATPase